MTAIAANRQVRRQLGEIAVRTMSAADMNSNPRINRMPKGVGTASSLYATSGALN